MCCSRPCSGSLFPGAGWGGGEAAESQTPRVPPQARRCPSACAGAGHLARSYLGLLTWCV